MIDRETWSERGAEEQDTGNLALAMGATVAVLAGATASLMCTLYAGRHNHSVMLTAMFAMWVLSPFAGLYAANAAARRRPARNRAALHVATLIVSVCSASIYAAVAVGPPRHNLAFTFLMLPAFSWVVIAVDYAIATRRRW